VGQHPPGELLRRLGGVVELAVRGEQGGDALLDHLVGLVRPLHQVHLEVVVGAQRAEVGAGEVAHGWTIPSDMAAMTATPAGVSCILVTV
jgi:hypothetical protein